MAITGACLCGAVQLAAARRPRSLTQCNCSVCRRYGTLWAYYRRSAVTIAAPRGALVPYKRRPRGRLRFVHCATCGCVVCWESNDKRADARLALNARLLDPHAMAQVPIKILDGDRTWKVLDTFVCAGIFVTPA
ncbi:MAG: GFA family protein [Deltaproteobacteria bacterium]|nr:GFA family protein [Deltaproteobacteria bacterium]